jgi:c(7)-type cytochrome triheme protein
VTFTHAKHFERLNGDCSACHPKVFPQSRAPLNYKKANHRAAEASFTSCAHCHAVGATSFAADSNCTKCHAQREYPKR